MSAVLAVKDVTVRFGGVSALEGVSFAVAPGDLMGLIGPNGAGKTTMMRVITGVIRPRVGAVLLRDVDVGRLSIPRRVRAGLAISQQLVKPFRSMSVRDNVALAAGGKWTARPLQALLHEGRHREYRRADELLDLVGITEYAARFPSEVPLGVLKRLEMARAIALEPQILLLDEPLAGLNHTEAAALADTIADLNRSGLSILLIEHNLGEVVRICGRVAVLDNGRKIADGPAEDVIASTAVRAAYVGTETDAAL